MSKLGPLVVVLSFLLAACGTASGDRPATTEDDDAPEVSASASDAIGAAESFVTFAQSGRPGRDVAWADPVRFSIAGEQVALLGPGFAERREGWLRCPGGATEYEGRDCPVSALTPIWRATEHDHDVVIDEEAPETVGCNRYAGPGVEAAATAWIRPEKDERDCFGDFAVAVVVDADSRIVAIDLFLSGP